MISCDKKNKLPMEAYSGPCEASGMEYFARDVITDLMKSNSGQRNILLGDLLHRGSEVALWKLFSLALSRLSGKEGGLWAVSKVKSFTL